MILEIYTDASIKTFNNGRVFGCSGAICSTTGGSIYTINPDTTNNKSELLAIYNGLLLADGIKNSLTEDCEIHIYSDSQFAVYGLTRWMYAWLKTRDTNGVIYGSNGMPVKNQSLFAMILSFMSTNNMRVYFHHTAGHVNYNSPKMLEKANTTYFKSNGYYLKPEDIYKVSYYNDIVDRTSRAKLDSINPNDFPVQEFNEGKLLAKYTIPNNFNKFIGR